MAFPYEREGWDYYVVGLMKAARTMACVFAALFAAELIAQRMHSEEREAIARACAHAKDYHACRQEWFDSRGQEDFDAQGGNEQLRKAVSDHEEAANRTRIERNAKRVAN